MRSPSMPRGRSQGLGGSRAYQTGETLRAGPGSLSGFAGGGLGGRVLASDDLGMGRFVGGVNGGSRSRVSISQGIEESRARMRGAGVRCPSEALGGGLQARVCFWSSYPIKTIRRRPDVSRGFCRFSYAFGAYPL